jgi:dimethylglycine dehydrogenase
MDEPSYRRANWFEQVGQEYRALRTAVGVLDHTCLGKFLVAGPEAQRHLNRLTCNALPAPGKVVVAPALSEAGHVVALWLIARLDDDRVYVTTAPNCTQRDFDILRSGAGAGVRIEDVSNRTAVLSLIGPQAPALLRDLGADPALRCFGPGSWIDETRIDWVPVRILRRNWSAVPVWELHVPMECQTALYEAILAGGEKRGLVDVGMRAAEAMRLEAGLPIFGIDIPPNFDPWQAGLGEFLAYDKRDFAGGSAIYAEPRKSCPRLVQLHISADEMGEVIEPWGDEPVLAGDRCVGVVTSAFFGYGVGKPVALAVLDSDGLSPGDLRVEILGRRFPAQLIEKPSVAEVAAQ